MPDNISITKNNFANYRLWYNRLDVIYEILKYAKNRELAVINPFIKKEAIRMIKLNTAQQFGDISKWINMNKRTWNLYTSLAVYKNGIPNQTFNMEKRDSKEWNLNHWKEIKHFDFLIDFDCDSHDMIAYAKEDVKRVSNFFNGIPHSIRYSGMGYHIMISGEYMPKITFNPDEKDNYFDFLRECLVQLRRQFSDFIDTGCHDPRRVAKLPYSLALYENDNYVCWPLRTLRELEQNSINYLSGAVLNDFEPMRDRGVPLLNIEKEASLKAFKQLLGNKYKRFVKDGK